MQLLIASQVPSFNNQTNLSQLINNFSFNAGFGRRGRLPELILRRIRSTQWGKTHFNHNIWRKKNNKFVFNWAGDYPDYKETDRRYDYQHEDHDPSYFRIVPDYIPKPNDYDSDSHHEDHAYDPNTYEYEGKHKKYGDHQKDHGQYKEYHVSYHV